MSAIVLFVELFEQRLLQLGLDLLEGLGGHLFVERGEDGFAFGGSEVFEDVGQIGGVHLGEALVLDAQLDAAGRIDLDDVDELPWNAVCLELARERLQRGAGQHSPEDLANGSAQADLDLDHAQQVSRALAHPLQIDIVDADDLAAVNVDDLAVDQVLLQVEIVALIFEGHHGAGRAQLEGAGWRLHHVLRRNDAQTGTRFQHQAGHLAGIRAGGYCDVFEPAPQLALGIGDRSAEERGEADASCGAGAHEVSVLPRGRVTLGARLRWWCSFRIGHKSGATAIREPSAF